MHTQVIGERFVRYYNNLGFKKLPGTSLLHPSIPNLDEAAMLPSQNQKDRKLSTAFPCTEYKCLTLLGRDRLGPNAYSSLVLSKGPFGNQDRQLFVDTKALGPNPRAFVMLELRQ
jgi:hypothetical protein